MVNYGPHFNIGDVVCIPKNSHHHVIVDINLSHISKGKAFFTYATNYSAWHEEDDLTLVHKATLESLSAILDDYEEI